MSENDWKKRTATAESIAHWAADFYHRRRHDIDRDTATEIVQDMMMTIDWGEESSNGAFDEYGNVVPKCKACLAEIDRLEQAAKDAIETVTFGMAYDPEEDIEDEGSWLKAGISIATACKLTVIKAERGTITARGRQEDIDTLSANLGYVPDYVHEAEPLMITGLN